jgi:hypothetical protein
MTSIIITYHNEPLEVLTDCLKQIKETIDIQHEIIVVDDCSDKPLPSLEGVTIIRNLVNVGVGQSFDAGVKQAKGENLIIMACDIRFVKNNWASLLVKEIEMHPKAWTCTTCVGLNMRSQCCDADIINGKCTGENCKNPDNPLNNMDFAKRRVKNHWHGATFIAFHDHESNPRKPIGYKSILEAKWLGRDSTKEGSYEVPCVLGAIYGVKKSWYEYIDGWWGHRQWGTLEPYISIKSWMMGGSCRVAPHIETGHIFKKKGTHGLRQENFQFNKLLTATLFVEDYKRLTNFLPNTGSKVKARQMLSECPIMEKREEYKGKFVMTFDNLCQKFNIDLRKERMIQIPESIFKNTPNNMELATIIRKIYSEQK